MTLDLWCSYCQRVSHTARPVQYVDPGSGPIRAINACDACRAAYRLEALDDEDE